MSFNLKCVFFFGALYCIAGCIAFDRWQGAAAFGVVAAIVSVLG